MMKYHAMGYESSMDSLVEKLARRSGETVSRESLRLLHELYTEEILPLLERLQARHYESVAFTYVPAHALHERWSFHEVADRLATGHLAIGPTETLVLRHLEMLNQETV
jgi:hypothetical protein